MSNLKDQSARKLVMDELKESRCDYFDHYIGLSSLYSSKQAIRDYYDTKLKQEVDDLAASNKYKFAMYKTFKPNLKPVDMNGPLKYVRLWLGSHYMPIETGRWRRIPRHDRKCAPCNTLGDERHYIYDCPEIERNDIEDIPDLKDLANNSSF